MVGLYKVGEVPPILVLENPATVIEDESELE